MIRLDRKRTFVAFMIALLSVTVAWPGLTASPVYGAVRVPDTIRVALFLNAPSHNFSSVTAAITLQSAGGLAVSWQDPAFAATISQSPSGAPVRFTMDGYRAVVLETADESGAIAALKKLQASSSAAFLTRLTKHGKPVYQLTEGAYATAAQAATALGRWQAAGIADGAAQLAGARVAGPWAVEAGPYASLGEAETAAAQISAAGLDAFAAIKASDGALQYVVRIGQEADTSSLVSLQQAAGLAGALNVRIPDENESYVLIRNDMSITATPGQSIALYAVSMTGSAVLRAQSGTPIQVIERSNRTYRGTMEVRVYDGALALINEVGLEPYLYSVVGAEVGPGWPAEAQKAQAVAARSYALSAGVEFQIADVVDTTRSQAYFGIGSENPQSTAGVEATAGEVLTYEGQIIQAVFSSNAGGVTADNMTEGWGSETGYLVGGITSPDNGPQDGLLDWYNVVLPSGQRGFIRSDLLTDSGVNAAGIQQMTVNANDIAVRVRPIIESTVEPITRLSVGTKVHVLGKVPENSAFSWIEAPVSGDALLASLKRQLPIPDSRLLTLEVSDRGPSGRVTELSVNGEPYTLRAADNWRSALGGLRSTLLEIEETARMSVVGADGAVREWPASGASLHVAGADRTVQPAAEENLFVVDGSGQARAVTTNPAFIFSVKGYGHGLGMSQHGARKLAEQGNDYRSILQYYYQNAILEKDAGG